MLQEGGRGFWIRPEGHVLAREPQTVKHEKLINLSLLCGEMGEGGGEKWTTFETVDLS